MTGLVYIHEAMGALPLAHNKLIDLEKVIVNEEYDDEYTKYHILPNNDLDLSNLNREEIEILDKIILKFGDYNSSKIIDYMHAERAYYETKDKEVISFGFAKYLREF
jgi:hypothetical protein